MFGLPCSASRFGPLSSHFPNLSGRHVAWRAPLDQHLTQGDDDGYWNREMVQPDQRVRIHSASRRREGCVRSHFRRREGRPGTLKEGQTIQYEVVSDRGKESAANLKVG